VCLGFLSTILLIPIHEGIHAIAYMLCGAKSVQFGANWKQLYFTASAHHFVTVYKELFIVGLLPFLVINLSGFFLISYISETYSLGIISCLVLHNVMCAGDFGILSYFFQNRSLEPLTFDDVSSGKTYFMVKDHN
jgi:hypothetical protein